MSKDLKLRLRRIILFLLRWITYALLLVSLYQSIGGTWDLFQQFVLVCILLVFTSYLAIDLQYVERKRILFFGLVAMVGSASLFISQSLTFWVSTSHGLLAMIIPVWVIVLLHIGIITLINAKLRFMHNRRNIGGLAFLMEWVALFAVIIAAMFALLTSAKMSVEKVSCDEFYGAVTQVVRFFSSPVLLGVDISQRTEQRISDIRDNSVGDLIGIDAWDIDMLDQALLSGSQANSDLPLDVLAEGGTPAWQLWLLGLVEEYRHRFVTELINDKELINKWLCSLIIDEVEKKLEKPWFRFSVAALLFFIFSPLISFLFWIVISIGFVIFQVLTYCGVRHKEKIMVEVEVIR